MFFLSANFLCNPSWMIVLWLLLNNRPGWLLNILIDLWGNKCGVNWTNFTRKRKWYATCFRMKHTMFRLKLIPMCMAYVTFSSYFPVYKWITNELHISHCRLEVLSERNDMKRFPYGSYVDIEHHLLRLALVGFIKRSGVLHQKIVYILKWHFAIGPRILTRLLIELECVQ